MRFAALRDMQCRRRRLAITIISTGLIFGMTLVWTGLANGFRVEARHTVDSMGVDAFVVKSGAPGVVASAPLATAASTTRDLLRPLKVTVDAITIVAVLLWIVALVIALLASVAGLRRAVAIDPALAFGGP
ncbi:hypothetical protein B8W66_19180 [Mycobacterium decipiens]|uniref:ABC transporter permease n=1 Tax=Mycobacterium decipiens TaxID=1430326 RepID=A0A1X2LR33_9MYCO|nr:hypothetical protein B8W66_19180 [Mycobacterium decipiens]